MNSLKEQTIQDTINQDTVNEEEILNQALMAYSLEYPWIVHQDILYNLTNDFFDALFKALRELKIILAATIDIKGSFARFTKEIKTTVVASNGFVKEYTHSGLVVSYLLVIDNYRRGLRP